MNNFAVNKKVLIIKEILMKIKLLIILVFPVLLSGCKDNTIVISGKLEEPVLNEYIYLDELKSTNLEPVDSVQLSGDGQFTFTREIKMPTFFLLRTDISNFFTILASPGEKINIQAGFSSLNEPESVTGSEDTEKMMEYNKALKNTIDKISGLSRIYSENTDNPDLPDVIATLDSMAQEYLGEINSYTKKYIDDNMTSLVSLVALYQQITDRVYVLDPIDDIDSFLKVDSSLFSLYPESEPVIALHEQVQQLVEGVSAQTGSSPGLEIGDVAPEIALASPDGEIIKLSSTRGKVVLLDFWAAWCPPCRAENPNLVSAYTKYASKGFEIFQVSLDKTKEDWVKGIEDDKLGRWIHVSDLKYWNSSVVTLYKFNGIPFNLLLDRDGRIIAKDLRGQKLETTLASVLE
jgi:thiol-disulfide isomerase/thioredoxin